MIPAVSYSSRHVVVCTQAFGQLIVRSASVGGPPGSGAHSGRGARCRAGDLGPEPPDVGLIQTGATKL